MKMNKQNFWRFRMLPAAMVTLHSACVFAVMQLVRNDLADPMSLKETPMAWNLFVVLDFPISLLFIALDTLWGGSLEIFMGENFYITYVPALSFLILGGIQYWCIGTIVVLLWNAALGRIVGRDSARSKPSKENK